jgi:peptidase M28-like protein
VSLRDVGFYLRGRLSRSVARVANSRSRGPLVSVPLDGVLGRSGPPEMLVPLLEGRSNPERQTALARHLEARGIPFARHHFRSFEGEGENFSVEIGHGDRVLVLIAHHDAVPGSPGANDNAASVGILLALMDRIASRVPPRLRVRLLFTAAEELGYLGARAYVTDTPLNGIVGVVSLELCGVGDSPVVWDAGDDSPFLVGLRRALEGLGLRRDESYHQIGRIPVFGSDHRAFAQAVPAYGLSVVPASEADALRSFIFTPVKAALVHFVRRPRPFDTYHTYRDSGETLNPGALDLIVRVLDALVAELG